MYRLLPPAPPLSPYIESYWLLRSDASANAPLRESIFVDGKADLLFNFGVPYRRALPDEQSESITMSNLDGQRTYPVSIVQSGAIDLIGVRFRPGGLSPFLTMPVHELSNAVIEASHMFGAAAGTLEARLYDCRENPQAQRALLDSFFMARLRTDDVYPLVQAIAARLAQQPDTSVHTVSGAFGYSIRSVDRFFRETMGFSPRTYIKIVRLQRALRQLSTDANASLAAVAFRSGYYDQAHFTRDFRAFTGQTPSAYRALLLQRRDEPPPNLVQFVQDPPRATE
jgi:AraC-like DNA-binding protein